MNKVLINRNSFLKLGRITNQQQSEIALNLLVSDIQKTINNTMANYSYIIKMWNLFIASEFEDDYDKYAVNLETEEEEDESFTTASGLVYKAYEFETEDAESLAFNLLQRMQSLEKRIDALVNKDFGRFWVTPKATLSFIGNYTQQNPLIKQYYDSFGLCVLQGVDSFTSNNFGKKGLFTAGSYTLKEKKWFKGWSWTTASRTWFTMNDLLMPKGSNFSFKGPSIYPNNMTPIEGDAYFYLVA